MNPIIRKAIDAKLSQLGVDWLRVDSLVVCTEKKSVLAVVGLEGEEQPVEITAIYVIDCNDIVVEHIDGSKPWIVKALALALSAKGNRVALPKGGPGMMARILLKA